MSEKTKIMLSIPELEKVLDTDWILTKRRITARIFELLEQQVPVINQYFLNSTAAAMPELLAVVPKITKGENYLELPYVLLDYPAVFNKQDIFAIRTMFWWGHFFSVTLQLSGKYRQLYADRILLHLKEAPGHWYVCVNKQPWAHHFEPGNYELANKPGALETVMRNDSFLKIALQFDLRLWDQLPQLLGKAYSDLLGLLED